MVSRIILVCVCCVLELVDLCDESGALVFMSKHLKDYASQILTPQKTYIICTIKCKFQFQKTEEKQNHAVYGVKMQQISFRIFASLLQVGLMEHMSPSPPMWQIPTRLYRVICHTDVFFI